MDCRVLPRYARSPRNDCILLFLIIIFQQISLSAAPTASPWRVAGMAHHKQINLFCGDGITNP